MRRRKRRSADQVDGAARLQYGDAMLQRRFATLVAPP